MKQTNWPATPDLQQRLTLCARDPYIIASKTRNRGAKSLGTPWDNWRKHHLSINLSVNGSIDHCFLPFLFHVVVYSHVSQSVIIVLTAHSVFWPINDFKTHFKLQKPTLTKAVWRKKEKQFYCKKQKFILRTCIPWTIKIYLNLKLKFFQLYFLEMATMSATILI